MVVKRRDIGLELWDIAKTNNPSIPSSFVNQLVAYLKQFGDLALESTMSEVILSKLCDDIDEDSKMQQTTTYDLANTPESVQTDDELFEMVINGMKKDEDPEFSVLRSLDDDINEILYKYARKIAPHKQYLTVTEWDLASISFYSILWGYDPNIKDLLFFLFSFSKQENQTFTQFDSFNNAVNELHTGYFDAKNVAELIQEKNYEKDLKEHNSELPNRKGHLGESNNAIYDNGTEKTPKIPTPANLTYFELYAKHENLKKFKSELEHLGYIAKDLPVEYFRRVFLFKDDYIKDKLKQQPCIPIEWLANKSHLGYLIKQLYKNKVIIEKEYYKIAENCFLYQGQPIPNTVFHGMQLPAINARKKLDRITALLMEKNIK